MSGHAIFAAAAHMACRASCLARLTMFAVNLMNPVASHADFLRLCRC